MKRCVKILCFVLVIALIVCSPFIHRLIVKGVLSYYFDDVRVAKVSLGFSKVQAKNVSVRRGDLTVRFENLDLKWRPKDWFAQKIFNVEEATLEGLRFSMENEPKDGLFFEKRNKNETLDEFDLDQFCNEIPKKLDKFSPLCQLPIAIGKLSIGGSFDVYENILGKFSFRASDFARAKTAAIAFKVDLDSLHPLVKNLKVLGEMSIGRDMSGAFESVELNSTINSNDAAENDGKTFLLNATYAAAQSGNSLRVTFSDTQSSGKIFDTSLNVDKVAQNVKFQTNITISDAEAKYLAIGKNLDPFFFHLYSMGECDTKQLKGLAKSNIEANFSHKFFKQTLPGLRSDLNFKFVSSVDFSNGVVEIQSIGGQIGDAAKKQVSCSFELVDNYKFQWQNGSILKNLDGLTLDIDVDNFDTSVLGALFHGWHIDSEVGGKCILSFKDGRMSLSGNGDKFCMSLAGVSRGKNKVIDSLKCSFEPEVVVGNEIGCSVSDLTCVDGNGANVLQGELKFGLDRASCSCSGCIIGVLADLLKQPIFKNSSHPTSGFATCSFDLGKSEDVYNGNAELKLKGVTCDGTKSPMNGSLNITLRELSTANEIKCNVEGKFHNAMDSDLSMICTLNNGEASSKNIHLDVRSSAICLSDVATIYKLFEINNFFEIRDGNEFYGKAAAAQSHISPWDDICLNASFKIGAIHTGDIPLCSNLSCTLKVDPKTISLQDMVCSFLDAPLLASYLIAFNGDDSANRYSVRANFSLSDLSASKCMLLLNCPPKALTGIFDANGSFSASKPSLGAALSHLAGRVDIIGSNGNIAPMSLLSNGQQGLIGLAGVASNLLNVGVTDDLIRILSDIPYEKMAISVVRQSNLDMNLESFLLSGPNLRMTATGTLKGNGGIPLRNYRLRLGSQICAKDDLAEIFDKFGWSTGTFDYYGYKIGPSFNVYGTLGNPDLSEVKALLASASTKVLAERAKNPSPSIISPETLLEMFQE